MGHITVCGRGKKRINILWDLMFQTDEQLLVNHPDIMVVDQEQRSSHVIDVAFPDDSNIREKEHERIEDNQGRREKVEQMFSRE